MHLKHTRHDRASPDYWARDSYVS